MRLLSDVDWPEFFESVSLVDELLRSESAFAAMDFASRDLYRRAIEQLARARSTRNRHGAWPVGGRYAGRERQHGTVERRRDPVTPDRRRPTRL